MYNKLASQSKRSKFGSENISYSHGFTNVMKAGLSSAIPIWELLKITEEQYDLLYKTPVIVEKKDE